MKFDSMTYMLLMNKNERKSVYVIISIFSLIDFPNVLFAWNIILYTSWSISKYRNTQSSHKLFYCPFPLEYSISSTQLISLMIKKHSNLSFLLNRS